MTAIETLNAKVAAAMAELNAAKTAAEAETKVRADRRKASVLRLQAAANKAFSTWSRIRARINALSPATVPVEAPKASGSKVATPGLKLPINVEMGPKACIVQVGGRPETRETILISTIRANGHFSEGLAYVRRHLNTAEQGYRMNSLAQKFKAAVEKADSLQVA